MRLGFSHCEVLKQIPKVEQNRVLAVKAKTLSEFKAGMRGMGLDASRVRVEDALKTKKEEEEAYRIRCAVAEVTAQAARDAEAQRELEYRERASSPSGSGSLLSRLLG